MGIAMDGREVQMAKKIANKGRGADLVVAAMLFTTLVTLGGIWITSSEQSQNQHHLHRTQDVATVQAATFQLNLMRSISGASILGAVVESDNGRINDFEHHADIIYSSLGGITNLQLAPDGIVQRIYPLEGHERALGHNLLKDDRRRKEADLAIKSRKVTVAGPFNLVQGGRAIVARNPVFLDADSPYLITQNSGDLEHARQGDEQFWGYSSVLIYFDTVMSMTDLPNLEAQGYCFRLWRKHPDTGAMDMLAGDENLPQDRVVSSEIRLPNATWLLDVASKKPAVSQGQFWGQWLLNLVFALLLSAWCYNLLRRPKILAFQVAERTKALNKAQSQLRLAATAFESHEAITITDVKGLILQVNTAFTRITGYQSEEVVGKTNAVLHSGLHDAEFYRSMWHGIRTKGHWDGEIWNKRKDGELYPAWLSISAVKGPTGETSHYVGHAVDISKRIHAEQELSVAKEKAETANRVKADFLAMMSHEIRTPLNGILGLLALLRDTRLDRTQQQYVETARESSKVLMTVINDVLDFSKIEAGKLELELSTVNTRELSNSVYEIMRPKAEAKGVAFEAVLDTEVPVSFLGDPGRLRQIMLNLVSNAIKFTDQGAIQLSLTATPVSELRFILRCQVSDTGIGIKPEDQTSLFEQFTTVDASFSRRYGGTGLGLSICKQLVELMHGKIGVNSTPNAGSTFWFEIEVDEALNYEGFSHASSIASVEETQGCTRILLVEDVVANRMVARTVLEQAGHKVEEAANGFEALHWLQQSDFDLVLMDISMPDMDGLQATAAIRKLQEPQANVPIIAMTAHAMKGDRERFLQAGMDDYLTKPLNLELLLDKVRIWKNKRATATDTPDLQGQIQEELDIRQTESKSFVDREVLEKLAQDTRPEMVPELAGIFIEDARQRLKRIQEACQSSDIDSLKQETHALGSSAGSFGLMRLHRLARLTEHKCHETPAEEALTAAGQLLSLAPKSLKALERIISEWS